MSRPTRIAGSFAIVVIAYWAYALLAVPWIEPPIAAESAGTGMTDPTGPDIAEEKLKLAQEDIPARLLANHRSQNSGERPGPVAVSDVS